MNVNLSVLDPLEQISYLLRGLYQEHGFSRYRMSKFEEYDLYSQNKDYLLSDGIITFQDPSGRLLALKPDVTLSIVKNMRDSGSRLQKLYYHENVYRVSAGSDGFREETQVGVECMGDIDNETLGEMVLLAAESLKLLSGNYVLEISHLDLLSALTDQLGVTDALRKQILRCAEQKNLHGIREICRQHGLPEGLESPMISLLETYGPSDQVLPRVWEIAKSCGREDTVLTLEEMLSPMNGTGMEHQIWIDFSATGDLKYYNGIALKGFLPGIPDPVLSGGQYDRLMRRMGRKDRAVGFAVFLHRLERLNREGGAEA